MLKGKVNKGETIISLPTGFQPSCIVQLLPPTAITALALHSAWSLIAVGTAHGLALYDYKNNAKILYKCTLNASGKESFAIRKTRACNLTPRTFAFVIFLLHFFFVVYFLHVHA